MGRFGCCNPPDIPSLPSRASIYTYILKYLLEYSALGGGGVHPCVAGHGSTTQIC